MLGEVLEYRNIAIRIVATVETVMKMILRKSLENDLGSDYDIDKHFKPSYNPWDQRLCLVTNADLFDAIKQNKASVVTDHIETFTADGIRTQQVGHLTFPIMCEHVEKTVFTVVRRPALSK